MSFDMRTTVRPSKELDVLAAEAEKLSAALCDLSNAKAAVKQNRLKDAFMEAQAAQRKIDAQIKARA